MSSQAAAGLALATGIWVIVGAAFITPMKQRDSIWVASSSERIASPPTLVRAAPPDVSTTGSIAR
jgi:hypothetical protein